MHIRAEALRLPCVPQTRGLESTYHPGVLRWDTRADS